MLALDGLRVRAMIRRQAYVQKRAPQRWFDLFIWPMVDTVIWGSIGAFVAQQGGAARSATPYMLSGIPSPPASCASSSGSAPWPWRRGASTPST
jgi:hypothetical protein